MAERVLGLITTIQDYSVHDGYGLRSIIFFKGCALRCGWCQNPESIFKKQELLFRPQKCITCGRCYNACKEAGVPAPDAVSMFFNFRPPSGDVRVDIDEAIETAEDEGYWLDLSKLPKNINKIKMYFT